MQHIVNFLRRRLWFASVAVVFTVLTTGILATEEAISIQNIEINSKEDTFATTIHKSYFINNNTTQYSPTGIKITQLPAKGELKIGTNAIEKDTLISATELTSLTYIPKENIYGKDKFKWKLITQDLESNVVNVTLNIEAVVDGLRFKGNLPKETKEDSLFTYSPMIIDDDIATYIVEINDSTSQSFILNVYDENMDVIETSTIDSNKIFEIKKNIAYFFKYNGSNTFKLNENETTIYEFSNQKKEFLLVVDNQKETGTKPYILKNDSIEVELKITENNIYEIDLKNKPSWITVNSNNGGLQGTPTQENVTQYKNIYFRVQKNNNFTNSETFDLTVINVNDKPSLKEIPQQGESVPNVNEGEELRIELTGIDEDNDPLSYFINTQPTHGKARIENNILIYQHNGKKDTMTDKVICFARDSLTESNLTDINISITDVNDPPVINSESILIHLGTTKTIELTATDEEDSLTSLKFSIVSGPNLTGAQASFINNANNQVTATSAGTSNQLQYTAPSELSNEQKQDQIIVEVEDSNGAKTKATIDIYFYHTNSHPTRPLKIDDITTRMGDLTPGDTIIWDVDNLNGFNDMVLNSPITYEITSNDKFSIEKNSGYLMVNQNQTFNQSEETIELTAVATTQNNEYIAVKFNVKVSLINSIDFNDRNDDGIPKEIDTINDGELILDNDFEFDERFSDYNKEEVTFEIDSGNKIEINKAKLKLKKVVIGGRDKATLKMENEGTLDIVEDIILGSEIGDSAEMILNHEDAVFKLGKNFKVGASGSAVLLMKNGLAEVNGSLTIGENNRSEGTITIEDKANLKIEKDMIIGKSGKATVNYSGGDMTVKGKLDLSQSSEGKFNMSGGRLTVNEIEITDSDKFEFTGGQLATPKITGSFTNSGGTVLVGETKNNVTTQSLSASFLTPKNIGDIDNHLNIIGDYVQKYGNQVISNLSMKIVSEKEEENGQLNVTGKAVFEGKLTISKSENMVFKLNQTFQIIKANSIEGSFSSMSLPELSADLAWDTSSLYTDGTLKITKSTYNKPQVTSAYTYPNPVIKNNDLTIQYSLTQSSNATLEIYNMLGRKIHTESFKYAQNGGKININKVKLPNNLTTNWPIGVYFIIVHDGKNTLAKGKFGLK